MTYISVESNGMPQQVPKEIRKTSDHMPAHPPHHRGSDSARVQASAPYPETATYVPIAGGSRKQRTKHALN